MFNIGTGEMVLICVVALLILGPKRLPEMARNIGRFFRNIQRQTDSVRSLVQREFLSMDLEDNNKAALKSMASSQSPENPPLSPAPEFPVTPAAAISHAPPVSPEAPPSAVADADPYHLSAKEPSAPEFPCVTPAAAISPALPVSPEAQPSAPAEATPSAQELSDARDAKLDSLFDTWLENRPELFSEEPSPKAPEELQKAPQEKEGTEL